MASGSNPPVAGERLSIAGETYRLLAPLSRGEGNFSEVWAAHSPTHGEVALKILRQPERDSFGLEARRIHLHKEARFLASDQARQCPNLVRLLAHGEHAGEPVLILERMRGNLADRLREWRSQGSQPELARAVHAALQIVQGLEAVHDANLVYLDLKPENLLLAEDAHTLKLGDFGTVKPPRPGGTSSFSGSVEYMAPEQALPAELRLEKTPSGAERRVPIYRVDRSADYYSLGLLLFIFITGRSTTAAQLAISEYLADHGKLGGQRQYGSIGGLTGGERHALHAALGLAPKAPVVSGVTLLGVEAPIMTGADSDNGPDDRAAEPLQALAMLVEALLSPKSEQRPGDLKQIQLVLRDAAGGLGEPAPWESLETRSPRGMGLPRLAAVATLLITGLGLGFAYWAPWKIPRTEQKVSAAASSSQEFLQMVQQDLAGPSPQPGLVPEPPANKPSVRTGLEEAKTTMPMDKASAGQALPPAVVAALADRSEQTKPGAIDPNEAHAPRPRRSDSPPRQTRPRTLQSPIPTVTEMPMPRLAEIVRPDKAKPDFPVPVEALAEPAPQARQTGKMALSGTSVARAQSAKRPDSVPAEPYYTRPERLQIHLNDHASIELVLIGGGEVEMGSASGQRDERPVHTRSVMDFYIADVEIGQAQFRAFCDQVPGRACEKIGEETAKPMANVSWYEAGAFTNWLARREGLPYTLPSEAQHAYLLKKRKASLPVPSDPPGLRAINSGLSEWTADCAHHSYQGAPSDGRAWLDDQPCDYAVVRGASYFSRPQDRRPSNRLALSKVSRLPTVGFRVALPAAALDRQRPADARLPAANSSPKGET